MKKILLGTTGLVGAAVLASAASAETPKVTLGGFSDFQAGYTSDDRDAGRNSTSFRNDNTVIVKVDGKSASGLGYGAQLDLEADVNDDVNNQGSNAARTFTYLEGSFGRVELGSNRSVAATQRIDASTLAVATGGINGTWGNFANNNNGGARANAVGSLNRNFLTHSKLAGEHGAYTRVGDETTVNATKINYYTPKFSGFQAGVSYTPQIEDRGQINNASAVNGVEDVWNLALGYENTFAGGYKLAASGTYETGTGGSGAAGATGFGGDIDGWNLGALVGYQGFSLAGSYGNVSDTGFGAAGGLDASYWTAGLGYTTGPIGLSATYLDSTAQQTATTENDFTNLVLGADYKLAPGLTPYAEVSFYEFDGTGAGNDNTGTAFILGTQVAF